jgi:uncharacterized protein (TIGR02246 family)
MQRLYLPLTLGLSVTSAMLGILLWKDGTAIGAPPGPPVVALDASDEAAVRTLVAEFAKTWNVHDMNAMHDLDSDDVQWINVSGNHWRGKATVFKGHDAIHRTVYAKSPMSVDKLEVRAIAPGVAVGVATMKFAASTTPSLKIPELRTRGSFIATKRDGVWKFAHFQNTTINEEHEKNDPATWDETGFVPGSK